MRDNYSGFFFMLSRRLGIEDVKVHLPLNSGFVAYNKDKLPVVISDDRL